MDSISHIVMKNMRTGETSTMPFPGNSLDQYEPEGEDLMFNTIEEDSVSIKHPVQEDLGVITLAKKLLQAVKSADKPTEASEYDKYASTIEELKASDLGFLFENPQATKYSVKFYTDLGEFTTSYNDVSFTEDQGMVIFIRDNRLGYSSFTPKSPKALGTTLEELEEQSMKVVINDVDYSLIPSGISFNTGPLSFQVFYNVKSPML